MDTFWQSANQIVGDSVEVRLLQPSDGSLLEISMISIFVDNLNDGDYGLAEVALHQGQIELQSVRIDAKHRDWTVLMVPRPNMELRMDDELKLIFYASGSALGGIRVRQVCVLGRRKNEPKLKDPKKISNFTEEIFTKHIRESIQSILDGLIRLAFACHHVPMQLELIAHISSAFHTNFDEKDLNLLTFLLQVNNSLYEQRSQFSPSSVDNLVTNVGSQLFLDVACALNGGCLTNIDLCVSLFGKLINANVQVFDQSLQYLLYMVAKAICINLRSEEEEIRRFRLADVASVEFRQSVCSSCTPSTTVALQIAQFLRKINRREFGDDLAASLWNLLESYISSLQQQSVVANIEQMLEKAVWLAAAAMACSDPSTIKESTANSDTREFQGFRKLSLPHMTLFFDEISLTAYVELTNQGSHSYARNTSVEFGKFVSTTKTFQNASTLSISKRDHFCIRLAN